MTRKEPLSSTEVAAEEPRIVFASQNNINALLPYVERVLEALGHPEAFVSDGSVIDDLLDLDADHLDEQGIPEISTEGHRQLREATKALKIPISRDDFIWKVARRFKKKAART